MTQRTWRIAGGVAITGAAIMAAWGTRLPIREIPVWMTAAYWGVFSLLLLLALYLAVLDLKFIRLQYLLGKREIFQETLGSEDFRTGLRKGQNESSEGRD